MHKAYSSPTGRKTLLQYLVLCYVFFFLVLEKLGFISTVKWISSQISEIKTNCPALLALFGATLYYCKTFAGLPTPAFGRRLPGSTSLSDFN